MTGRTLDLAKIESIILGGFEPNFGWDDLTHDVVHNLLAIAQGQREELDDLRSAVRFLAKMWSKTSWLRLEIIQALHNHNEDKAKALVTMQWPIVQGLQNQLDLEKVAEQKHETRRIRAAIDALLGIGTKK